MTILAWIGGATVLIGGATVLIGILCVFVYVTTALGMGEK